MYEPSGPLYVAFNSALRSGDLDRIRRTASRLPEIKLDRALDIVVAYRNEPEYERAAIRWLGRFCLKTKGLTIETVFQVTEALEQLPDHHERVAEELRGLMRRR